MPEEKTVNSNSSVESGSGQEKVEKTEPGVAENVVETSAENVAEKDAELTEPNMTGTEESSASVAPEGQRPSEDGEKIKGEEQETPEVSLEEKVMALQAELEQVKAKADDYYAHLQRLQAEFDNYRKRTAREKEELVKYASERLVKNLLPVLDNFERATQAAQSTQDVASYAQGVEMILRQFKDVLSREGLTPIECVGQPFDPQCHEAVMQVDAEGYPENTVVEELQKGYYLKDKLLRPSMVKVSR